MARCPDKACLPVVPSYNFLLIKLPPCKATTVIINMSPQRTRLTPRKGTIMTMTATMTDTGTSTTTRTNTHRAGIRTAR